MEPERSLPNSQNLTIEFYPKPTESGSQFRSLFYEVILYVFCTI